MENSNAVLDRNNYWHCIVCGESFPASALDWHDVTPTCPACHTQDMLFEEREELPPPPAVIVID